MGSIDEIWCITVSKGIGEKERINTIEKSLNEIRIRYTIKN